MKHFLSKIINVIISLVIIVPSFAAESNLPKGDIGDYGVWTTETNLQKFSAQLSQDVNAFQAEFQEKIVQDYVPIEAKVGLAFMNGLSFVAHVLDSSLVRFAILFMIIAYMFWSMIEGYMIISGGLKPYDGVVGILKHGAITFMWIGILQIGPAETFMMLISPIMQVATYVSDGILNIVTSVAGIRLPDTCAAIRDYATTHISNTNIISADRAADIMCLPTRLSGFCYTAVSIGWKWMSLGIGRSAFSFLCGGVFVGGFIYVAWRFMFVAFGVIADLFMGVMMLPFTAVAETIESTKYKGIIGNIFNEFMKIFSAEKLNAQITRFINAALHFIVLSVVIALCSGLLSEVVTLNNPDAIPHIEDAGFFITILVLALCIYLAKNADIIANDLGGSINTKIGDGLRSDINNMWTKTKGNAKKVWKIIKDS